jgi:threonine/homoserine/homoserine lactone efflux protein
MQAFPFDPVLFSGLVFFALTSSLTPGPNNIMLMNSGATFGFRRTIPHMLGVSLGYPAMVLVVGFGLASVFQNFPILHEIVRWVGVAYMLWMAWGMAHAGKISDKKSGKGPKPVSFFKAVLFQWVNPKGWTMAVGSLAAYTTSGGDYIVQLLWIALVFALSCVPSVIVWTAFGKGVARFLSSPQHLKIFNWSMALLMALAILPVIFEGLPKQAMKLN